MALENQTEVRTRPLVPTTLAYDRVRTAGTYVITGQLSDGARGNIFSAYDHDLGRAVALKRLAPTHATHPTQSQALRREAKLLANLPHPHIVTLHSFYEGADGPMLIMEQLHGDSLRTYLNAHARLPLSEAMTFATHALSALAHLHARGLVHGAVQPAHLFLCEDGDTKLLDFAHAHTVHTPPPTAPSSADSRYRAPELTTDTAPDARSDVYSLGVTLCEALTGKTDCATACAELTQRADAALVAIVQRACARDPQQRFANAGTMLDALNGYALSTEESIDGAPTRARPNGAGRRLYRALTRGVRLELLLLATALVLIAALGLHPYTSPPPVADNTTAREQATPARAKAPASPIKPARETQAADKYGELRKAWANP